MKKNVLQDVMPPRKRSIRDIPIGHKRRGSLEYKSDDMIESKPVEQVYKLNNSLDIRPRKIEIPEEDHNNDVFDNDKKNNASRGLKAKWWLIVLAFVAILAFLFSAIFSGAEVVIYPKQEKVNFQLDLTAIKEGVQTEIPGVLFKTVTITSEGSKTTKNFTEKEVAKKASGEIVIFNEYDSAPQRLVINTRFESSDGLIYRIPKSITVPGKKIGSDGKVTPGSIQVTVYADAVGEEYNIGLSDFTVPGFKGTDRFSKFYARSKTSMSGGFSGMMKVVADTELEGMTTEIKTNLEKDLKTQIYSQIPEGFVLYDEGIFFDFEPQNNVDEGDSVKVVQKGTLTAIIFDKNILSNFVAKNVIDDLGDGVVEIVNIEDLKFTLSEKDYINISGGDTFEFSLEGDAQFAWVFDENKLKTDLAGKSKKDIDSILSQYSGVDNMEVILKPFWKRSFPSSLEKIKITRNLE
ncbi:hypothetical protein A2996_00295 [Candidatus Campbellbacteria bacterium RIFCSPLOWO2_01_FULL_34_15]|uniref:Baseplate protein J-like domain-containing protein n=2 Tax=Candidatus Campbelliibacteriota TaxID=1752727 RepID=A0A1F5EME1_9BACT|nr:MAG: hypothetical protein A2811_00445 [Candidatus Campbellbacteria bacterium RIFCSPHIGHO2_01_FULL_34_10]OGD68559.1 MAG: hypothetical protein A2996_00295 [Candidatus Campbellbacteria bacterium RIFCSPLOWO2_01_FULL_34_15]